MKEEDYDDDDDDDDDDDESSDDITQNRNDDLTGKLTNVSVSDFVRGVSTSKDTTLSTRCVRSLSWPEIACVWQH